MTDGPLAGPGTNCTITRGYSTIMTSLEEGGVVLLRHDCKPDMKNDISIKQQSLKALKKVQNKHGCQRVTCVSESLGSV